LIALSHRKKTTDETLFLPFLFFFALPACLYSLRPASTIVSGYIGHKGFVGENY
jgi:hypothetical protein